MNNSKKKKEIDKVFPFEESQIFYNE